MGRTYNSPIFYLRIKSSVSEIAWSALRNGDMII
uniref:Uncharacterized protein n=1 Tax=Arundo donax TaxID=35708 RepID=A0A0A9BW01_ARUDO